MSEVNTAALIGNGPSRIGLDFYAIRKRFGIVVACNRFYVEHPGIADVIVALDADMCDEIEAIPKQGRGFHFLTRGMKILQGHAGMISIASFDGHVLCPLWQINGGRNNNSGIIAGWYLAEIKEVKKIYMFGMDFGSSERRLPVLPGLFRSLMHSNPNVEWIRVGEIGLDERTFWNGMKPMRCISYEDFEKETS